MPIKNCFRSDGGPTIINVVQEIVQQITNVVQDDILGVIDFSTLPDTSFNSDGDYVIPIQLGKQTNAITISSKQTANLFAAGYQQINNGQLEMKSGGVTSAFGLDYWSANIAPYLCIDMTQLLPSTVNDPYYEKFVLDAKIEFDPFLSGDVVSNVETYTYLQAGFTVGLEEWEAGGFAPNHIMFQERLTSTASKGSMTMGYSLRNTYTTNAPSKIDSSMTIMNFSPTYTPDPPYASFWTDSPNTATVMSAKYPCMVGWSNGDATIKQNTSAVKNGNSNAYASVNARRGSKVYFYISCMRSSGSPGAGDVPRRINKITFYKRDLL